MLIPAARTLPIDETDASLQLVSGLVVLYGWSFEETTDAADAELALYDGTGDNGARLVSITLNPNESTRDMWGYPGMAIESGLFLSVVSGSVKGAVWYTPGTLVGNFIVADGPPEVWSGDL